MLTLSSFFCDKYARTPYMNNMHISNTLQYAVVMPLSYNFFGKGVFVCKEDSCPALYPSLVYFPHSFFVNTSYFWCLLPL